MVSEVGSRNPDESSREPHPSDPEAHPPLARPVYPTGAPPVYASPPFVPELRPPTSYHGYDVLIGVALSWAGELAMGLVVGVIAAILLMPTLAQSAPLASPDDFLQQIPAWLMFGTTFLSNVWTFAVCWFLVCRKYGKSLTEGFAISRVPAGKLVISVLLGLTGAVIATYSLSEAGDLGDSPLAKMLSTREDFYVFCVFAVVIPPFEEIYYRGFLYPVLREKLGPVFAILLISLWFTAVHAFQLAGDWKGLIVILIMGTTWTILREVTKSLVPSILCHFAYNGSLVAISLWGPH